MRFLKPGFKAATLIKRAVLTAPAIKTAIRQARPATRSTVATKPEQAAADRALVGGTPRRVAKAIHPTKFTSRLAGAIKVGRLAGRGAKAVVRGARAAGVAYGKIENKLVNKLSGR